ncbi:MAG: hypothetical protein R2741_03555 [Methanolobus sp.]
MYDILKDEKRWNAFSSSLKRRRNIDGYTDELGEDKADVVFKDIKISHLSVYPPSGKVKDICSIKGWILA